MLTTLPVTTWVFANTGDTVDMFYHSYCSVSHISRSLTLSCFTLSLSMHAFSDAKEYFEESLGLNKDYEKAATWLGKVNQELDRATESTSNTEPAPLLDNDSSSDENN